MCRDRREAGRDAGDDGYATQKLGTARAPGVKTTLKCRRQRIQDRLGERFPELPRATFHEQISFFDYFNSE